MSHDNCSRPGEGIFTAKVVGRDGSSEEFDLSTVSLSWGRATSQIVESTISTSADNTLCCDNEFREWFDKLFVYRDGVRVAVYDYYKDLPNPNNGSNVLYYDSRMYLIARQVWLSDQQFNYRPVDAFTRVIQEAQKSGVETLYQPRPYLPETVTVKGWHGRPLSQSIELLAGWIDWTEYSDPNNESVVRYGDLRYETGVKLTNEHWDDGIPQIVTDGKEAATSVIVHSNLSGDPADGDVKGWWPRNKDGSLTTGILPLAVEFKDIASTAEASAMAKRLYEKAQNFSSIRFSNSGKLSEDFPVCVHDLYPGAVFDVEATNSCRQATGKYVLESIIFDIVGGREASVQMELKKAVELQ